MKNFTYYRPKTTDEAVGLLDAKWGTSELLAGGTDLLDLQKEYVAQPDKVVSLGGIEKFNQVTVLEKNPPIYVLGAGITLAEIAANKNLREKFPSLTTAASDIGGPQIRNMGTLGGNLCQRNRCWYFRDEHVNCLLKGGDKCYALDGENRYHAIFIKGHKCVIVNPSTLAPALIALGATIMVQGPKGQRTAPLAEGFFHAPSSPTEREHTLAPNEMIVSVSIPDNKGMKNASYEVRHKIAYDWPLVQAAVAFRLNGNKAEAVQVVLGHVAPTPIISNEAAKALEGKEVTEATATAAGEATAKMDGIKALGQNAYKIKLVAVAVKRAILTAAGKAGQKQYWEV
jgi:xanthine dehydrogenase YagS FAD-binding subunit